MTWAYARKTGAIYDTFGTVKGKGYSGHGEGLNNVQMEAVHDVGPLPKGKYTILAPEDDMGKTGPYSMRLEPHPETEMYGRSGMRMHGDNADHTASHGCIVTSRGMREIIWKSDDHELEVL